MSSRSATRRFSWRVPSGPRFVVSAGLLWLCGCSLATAEPSPGDLEIARAVYVCADGYRFSARSANGSALIGLTGRTVELQRVPAASGARYEGDRAVLWAKGQEALLEVGGTTHVGCVAHPVTDAWEESRLLGAELRAIGQEPGWSLEIYPDRVRYVGDYGATNVVVPGTRAAAVSGGVRYLAEAAGHRIEGLIEDVPCRDVMSGDAFPLTVTLDIDGRRLRGCGRRLADEPR